MDMTIHEHVKNIKRNKKYPYQVQITFEDNSLIRLFDSKNVLKC